MNRWSIRGLAVVACLAATSHAAAQVAAPTFRSSTKLIVETVRVTDKNGKAVEGLTADDFAVTEDGEVQTVSFAEFQRLPTAARPTGGRTADAPVAAPAPLPGTQAVLKYADRRLLILYFDLSAMLPPDLMRAFGAALTFVETQMQPWDMVSIMSFRAGVVRVKQEFTSDRDVLRNVLNAVVYGQDRDGAGQSEAVDANAPAFGQDSSEFSIFNTDRQLAALQTAMAMLQRVPEQKSLVYFASGLRLNGVDNQAQLRATINAAIRANVALFPIDARGLVASAPLGDATRASVGGLAMLSGQQAQTESTAFQRSQDTLYALGKDTGGQALFDFNDLSLGIVQAADAQTSYYIVGYYTTHGAADGRFRRVHVSLTGAHAGELTYRQGYFADKAFAKFTAADKERQLEDALMLENPVTDIAIAMEVNYFQLNRAEYFVPVAISVPGHELALARRGGAKHTVLDVIGEVKDNYGNTVQNVRDKLDIRLSDETAAQLATRPIHYEAGFTLLPGAYAIKYLLRDAETGRMGTYQTTFTIPNLEKDDKRVSISSVVLSGQRVPLGGAIYSVHQRIAVDTANPLVWDGQKLIPSVTHVFSRSRDLFVFLQAYERSAAEMRPLVAFVTFYRDGIKAFETAPLAIRDGLDPVSKAVPLRFRVALTTLPLGPYDCQVTVLDPTAQKATFRQIPIVVVN
jgi:VWFA-related protein